MNVPGPAVLSPTVVPELEALGDLEVALLALVALVLTGFFAVLRSALLHSVPARVLEKTRSDAERRDLQPLLERAESLATSASIFEITCQIFFVTFVFLSALAILDPAPGETLSAGSMGLALGISVPLLVFAGEVLPSTLRGERSDRLLRSVLPTFDLLRRPLVAVIYGLEAMRRGTMRLLRIPERPRSVRRIVEGLRDVIEDSEREDDLRESEREIIENVVEFYDVDVAEVMTPRTELTAVEVGEGVHKVVSAIAESGHTRIPVYEKNLDTIVGVAYAQEMLQLVSAGEVEQRELQDLLRPVSFVPETRLVSELLADFRRDKQKLAVVLDEYGGTAGIVTMGDVVAELVGGMRAELGEAAPEPVRHLADGAVEVLGGARMGDVVAELVGGMRAELGEAAPEPVRHLADGAVEVLGGARMGEVNEGLELDLPEEEDYETLAGFVLAELGRFPRRGESFEWDGIEFTVIEASDRRVLKVLLRLPEAHKLG